MDKLTVEQLQENFEEYMDRVEKGESLGIVNKEGQAVVVMPADEELIRIHTELNNEAP